MRSWIFYPRDERNDGLDRGIQLLFGPDSDYATSEELHHYMPESREKKQGASIGFYCGNLLTDIKRFPSLLEGVASYPHQPYRADYVPTPKVFLVMETISVRSVGFEVPYLWTSRAFRPTSVTVDGMYPDQLPNLSIRGCHSFLFSPYSVR